LFRHAANLLLRYEPNTTGKIIVLYSLMFWVLDWRREDNGFWTEFMRHWQKPELRCSQEMLRLQKII
jgi:hypothetical protein